MTSPLQQLGILQSKSKSSGSLWVKMGGEGLEVRVIDGILQTKAKLAISRTEQQKRKTIGRI